MEPTGSRLPDCHLSNHARARLVLRPMSHKSEQERYCRGFPCPVTRRAYPRRRCPSPPLMACELFHQRGDLFRGGSSRSIVRRIRPIYDDVSSRFSCFTGRFLPAFFSIAKICGAVSPNMRRTIVPISPRRTSALPFRDGAVGRERADPVVQAQVSSVPTPTWIRAGRRGCRAPCPSFPTCGESNAPSGRRRDTSAYDIVMPESTRPSMTACTASDRARTSVRRCPRSS